MSQGPGEHEPVSSEVEAAHEEAGKTMFDSMTEIWVTPEVEKESSQQDGRMPSHDEYISLTPERERPPRGRPFRSTSGVPLRGFEPRFPD
jgi:hypothetical protein